jgi:hypothetical protein
VYGSDLGFRDFRVHQDHLSLQFSLQLPGCDLAGGSAPEGFAHAVGGVAGEFGGDVGVALGLAELGVAEDLLDDADVGALLQQEGRGCVPGVVYTRRADSGFGEEVTPVLPVVVGVDGRAGGGGEDQVPVLPGGPGRLDYGADLWGMTLEDFEIRVAQAYFHSTHCPAGTVPPDASLDSAMKSSRFSAVELVRFAGSNCTEFEARLVAGAEPTKGLTATGKTALAGIDDLCATITDDGYSHQLQDIFDFLVSMEGLTVFWRRVGAPCGWQSPTKGRSPSAGYSRQGRQNGWDSQT